MYKFVFGFEVFVVVLDFIVVCYIFCENVFVYDKVFLRFYGFFSNLYYKNLFFVIMSFIFVVFLV